MLNCRKWLDELVLETRFYRFESYIEHLANTSSYMVLPFKKKIKVRSRPKKFIGIYSSFLKNQFWMINSQNSPIIRFTYSFLKISNLLPWRNWQNASDLKSEGQEPCKFESCREHNIRRDRQEVRNSWKIKRFSNKDRKVRL